MRRRLLWGSMVWSRVHRSEGHFMIAHPDLDALRAAIRRKNDALTARWVRQVRSNPYYHSEVLGHLRFVIPSGASVLHLHCNIGQVLVGLSPERGVGVEASGAQIEEARRRYPHLTFIDQNPEELSLDEKFDYIVISSLQDIVDVRAVLERARRCCTRRTRLIVLYYNYAWHPLVDLGEALGVCSSPVLTRRIRGVCPAAA